MLSIFLLTFFKPSFKHYRFIDQSKVENFRDKLVQTMFDYKHLINIFEFDSPRHHGNLEEAILDALFNSMRQ